MISLRTFNDRINGSSFQTVCFGSGQEATRERLLDFAHRHHVHVDLPHALHDGKTSAQSSMWRGEVEVPQGNIKNFRKKIILGLRHSPESPTFAFTHVRFPSGEILLHPKEAQVLAKQEAHARQAGQAPAKTDVFFHDIHPSVHISYEQILRRFLDSQGVEVFDIRKLEGIQAPAYRAQIPLRDMYRLYYVIKEGIEKDWSKVASGEASLESMPDWTKFMSFTCQRSFESLHPMQELYGLDKARLNRKRSLL